MAQDNDGHKVLFTMPDDPGTGLIPFGKYRGQPVDALLADQSYLQWLLAQAWFAQRYSTIHTLVINHGTMPDETPEHNALQLRFLDDPLCIQAAHAWIQHDTTLQPGVKRIIELHAVTFEHRGVDVFIPYMYAGWTEQLSHKDTPCGRGYCHDPAHWIQGWYKAHGGASLELKPSLGDDYPAVLRKMLNGSGSILVYERWQSQMPEAQVAQLFARSGKLLLSLAALQQFPSEVAPFPVPEERLEP